MSYQFNVPALKIDALLHSDGRISARGKLERRVVYNCLLALKAAGFIPVELEGDDDEQLFENPETAVIDAMERLFNLDDAYVLFNPDGKYCWVRFVFGNGRDVISDWAPGVDGHKFSDALTAYCDSLDALEGT